MKSAFLFVYGTLLDNDNEFAAYLRDKSTFYSDGKVKGKLYDIGEYPGAILAGDTDEYIYGSILQIDEPEKVFMVVDEYEGFGSRELWPNEFVRVLADIETTAGMINCWIYLYNQPVNGLRLIAGGKYKK